MESAREFRLNNRESQAKEAQVRLFNSLGTALFENGWNNDSPQYFLDLMTGYIAAEHGIIATESAGTLNIVATKGQTLPQGTRVPMLGIFATLLKHPVKFKAHQYQGSIFWTYTLSDTDQEYLIPIAIGQQSVGLIALSGQNLQLSPHELITLHSVSGMLGVALKQSSIANIEDKDLTVIELLTPREREVFALLPSGLSNRELATKLGISAGTVKIHVERVLSKLNVRDRTQAAVKAYELGYRA
nr:response regulator transcription factor [uncultured Methylotenera sp.]